MNEHATRISPSHFIILIFGINQDRKPARDAMHGQENEGTTMARGFKDFMTTCTTMCLLTSKEYGYEYSTAAVLIGNNPLTHKGY